MPGLNRRKFVFQVGLPTIAVFLAGCHSAYVEATVKNRTSAAINLIQVEYPSASFGTQSIAAGQEFKYRFKVLGSSEIKLTYTDSAQVDHKSIGPLLVEGNEGKLAVEIGDNGAQWHLSLIKK